MAEIYGNKPNFKSGVRMIKDTEKNHTDEGKIGKAMASERKHNKSEGWIKRAFREYKREAIAFILVNEIFLCILIAFPFYCKYMWEGAGSGFEGCTMLKLFKLYCPACGGTRAMWYLLHFDLLHSFIYNPFVPILAAIVLYCDLRALVSFIKGRNKFFYLDERLTWILVGSLLTFWIIRNILLVFFGYDPIGDTDNFWLHFWEYIKARG